MFFERLVRRTIEALADAERNAALMDRLNSNSPETMVRLRALRSFSIQPYLKNVNVPDPHFPLFYGEGDILELPFSQAIRLIASGNAARVMDDEER